MPIFNTILTGTQNLAANSNTFITASGGVEGNVNLSSAARLTIGGFVLGTVQANSGASDVYIRVNREGVIVGNSGSRAVSLVGTGATLENWGEIAGAYVAIVSDVPATIRNYGVISATYVLDGSSGADTVINAGWMSGGLLLGGGNNLFDGRLGMTLGVVDGGGDNDTLLGGAAAETFGGLSGNDLLDGGAGADSIDAGAGNNTVYGGDDDDRLIANIGNDLLYGGAGADFINADLGNNTGYGDDGADTLRAGNGTDLLYGGTGADSIDAGAANNTVYGDDGADTLRAGNGTDLLYGGSGADDIDAGAGNNTVYGGDDADRLITNSGFDLLYGGAGADFINVGAGNNTVYGDDGADTLRSGNESDLLYGGTGADSIDAGAGINTVYGDDGDDTLIADNGNDMMDGGAGADSMAGGSGDDRYVVDDIRDRIVERINGGTDTVLLRLARYSVADAFIENVIGDTPDQAFAITGTGLANRLIGGDLADTLTGGAGNDTLIGLDGDDRLDGGTEGDLLDGGDGHDTLSGGAGDDVLRGIGLDYEVYEVAASPFVGIDVGGFARPSFTDLDGDGDLDLVVGEFGAGRLFAWRREALGSYTAMDGASGRPANPFAGFPASGYATPSFTDLDNDGDLDVVMGGAVFRAWRREFNGSYTAMDGASGRPANPFAGIDVRVGYAHAFIDLDDDGDLDLVVGDEYGRLVAWRRDGYGSYTALTGTDDPFPSTGLGVNNPAPNFIDLDGNGDLDMVVGARDGTLRLFALGIYIDSDGGNDSLLGGNDQDTLDGGAGDDTMVGETGNDSLFGGTGNDFLEGDWGQDTFSGGAGADLFYLTHLERSNRTNIGSSVAAPDVILDFNRAEGDRIALIGNAYPYPAPVFYYSPTEEALPLRWMGSRAAVASLTEGLTLPGGAVTGYLPVYWIAKTGGDGWVAMDLDRDGILDSTDFAVFVDTVDNQPLTAADFPFDGFEFAYATVLADVMMGQAGKDLMYGLAGADTMDGASGENVLWGGDGDDWLLAGGGDDVLVGGLGDDVLNGGSGRNTLEGGAGDDTYHGDAATSIIEAVYGGNDLLVSSASITNLTSNIENILLTGSAALNAIGTEFNNRITGNSGNNALFGGAGDDSLFGGGGTDTLDGGSGNDLLVAGAERGAVSGGAGDDVVLIGATTLADIYALFQT
jgi:Ca2+-binding RTX toxin-like protein